MIVDTAVSNFVSVSKKSLVWRIMRRNMKKYFVFLIFLCLIGAYSSSSNLTVSSQDLALLTKENSSFILLRGNDGNPGDVEISFNFTNGNDETLLEQIDPVKIGPNSNITITVVPLKAGHVDIIAVAPDNTTNTRNAFVRVVVMKSQTLELVSTIIGWIYFAAWSVSFYPQIVDNFRRKSVIGLNFDFLALNIVGFTLYGCYNVALYWIDSIQEDYLSRHPRGIIPVQTNDVFFPIHAVFACAVTIIQCFMFERGMQKVSKGCWGILGAIAIFVVIILILAFTHVLAWLDFLQYCSYVKLGITLIKYMPQAYMNYRRKSTVGWSIGNILLDFTGGSLSIVQMILISYNNDDWSSIFGDPTKFGLGFFSVVFDIFFMLQHYIFYRGNLPHETLAGSSEELRNSPIIPGTPEV
eukprot:GFUD01035937.1.p1 GENE.GFUD01035937.1~~GFUD01035937.1.p1  ORF type:complete len:411 (+),score=26.97 GFUD01035937.1:244-1476(+)